MLELIDGRDQMAPVHISRPKVLSAGGNLEADVRGLVDHVRMRGDEALLELTERFDGVALAADRIRVDPAEIDKARKLVPPELVDALEVMSERLRSTCERQAPSSWMEESVDEVVGEIVRPLRRVGIYVPGGRAAYPSSVIMAVVPARVAGVEGIALCSPPDRGGEVSEAVLAACAIAGVDEVYRMGGAQAIAAFAYGTETVRPVDKVVGPGNAFVTLAKRAVAGWIGTDSEAGPTEIAVIADGSAAPDVLAADIIAQAEHGPHGTHALITWVPELIQSVNATLEFLVASHERPEDVENALTEGGRAVLVRDLEHAIDTANAFAPEHLELIVAGAMDALDRVRNAGAVFVGRMSPVSVGDYVAGTNHVLPSGGSARWASGLGVQDFVKRIYICGMEESALTRLAPHVEALASAEGLHAHARAVRVRLDGKA